MRRARGALIWLLVLALAAYGCSSVLVQLLGPAHRHVPDEPAAVGWLDRAGQTWHDLQAWRAQMHARWLPQAGLGADPHPQRIGTAVAGHVSGVAAAQLHAHAHATFQRHHHDAHDPTVIALESTEAASGTDGSSPAGAGSATLPLGLAAAWALPAVPAAPAAWRPSASDRWTDAVTRPLEHPPRA